ncbi:MAG: FixH family protein [Pseudomonadota bacterium]
MNTTILSTLAALSLAGCMTPPSHLDVSLQHPSEQGRYVVTLEPPPAAPAINQIHSWKVKIATANGEPVTAAQIGVDGGMPQHGHGLPTQPLVRRQLADGTYLLEGMKFSMTGWWEIKLALAAAQGPDKVTFNVVVNDPAASRK